MKTIVTKVSTETHAKYKKLASEDLRSLSKYISLLLEKLLEGENVNETMKGGN